MMRPSAETAPSAPVPSSSAKGRGRCRRLPCADVHFIAGGKAHRAASAGDGDEPFLAGHHVPTFSSPRPSVERAAFHAIRIGKMLAHHLIAAPHRPSTRRRDVQRPGCHDAGRRPAGPRDRDGGLGAMRSTRSVSVGSRTSDGRIGRTSSRLGGSSGSRSSKFATWGRLGTHDPHTSRRASAPAGRRRPARPRRAGGRPRVKGHEARERPSPCARQ